MISNGAWARNAKLEQLVQILEKAREHTCQSRGAYPGWQTHMREIAELIVDDVLVNPPTFRPRDF